MDTAQVLEELRARVAERKAAGHYPDDLPDRMAAHFDALLRRRGNLSEPSHDQRLEDALSSAREAGRIALDRIPTTSRVPGGAVVHRTLRKATARETRGVVQQVRQSNDAVRGVLEALIARVRELENGTTVELSGIDQRLAESTASLRRVEERGGRLTADAAVQRARTDALEAASTDAMRRLGWAEAAVERLERVFDETLEERISPLVARIERLERAERDRSFRPWFDLGAFEARFRGTRDDILERYEDLVPYLVGREPVLDLGCGRGEFLELLAKHGVAAQGVELDDDLVAEVNARGFQVWSGDGLAHLETLPDDSLGGVVMLQVIEHLTPQQQLGVMALAHRKLRTDGRLLIETVNPTSLYVYAHAMYLDPTHTQPVHPRYLEFLVDELGFADVGIQWRSPVPDAALPLGGERTRGDLADAPPVPARADRLQRALHRLDPLLFGYQDYLLVATK
jgi:SAM-dependent methyltransferase